MSSASDSFDPERRVQFALDLARGATVADAARRIGVSERTGYRWLHDATVQDDIDRHRHELSSAAIGVWKASQATIAAAGLQAIRELVDIMQNDRASFAARVQAGKALLDHWDRSVGRLADAPAPDQDQQSDDDLSDLVLRALEPLEPLDA